MLTNVANYNSKKRKKKRGQKMNLNLVVFEKRMIKSRLMGDVNTVYDVPIWTLLAMKNQKELKQSIYFVLEKKNL